MKIFLKNSIRRRYTKKVWETVEDYWKTAFPPEINMKSYFKQKKLEYKEKRIQEEKTYSQEEIDELEKNIPKWKKGQLVFVKKEEDEAEMTSRFEKIKQYIYSEKGIIKKTKKTEEKKEDDEELNKALDEMEREYDEFRQGFDTLKDRTLNIAEKNILYKKTKEGYKKLREKVNNSVATHMAKHYPNFDMDFFEKQIQFIFEELYCNYLNHNMEKIKLTCLSEARGFFKSKIEVQKTNKKIHKYKAIFNLRMPILESATMVNDSPLFVFSIQFHELVCLVDQNDPEVILEGGESGKTYNDFLLYVIPHPDAKPEKTGHEWAFIKVYERNKVKMLL